MLRRQSFAKLASELLANHGKNENGCILTDYSKIEGLRVGASTTNGDSGMGKFFGVPVYWHLDHGLKWYQDKGLVQEREPKFIVERR